MWLTAVALGLLVVVAFWVALFLAARHLPPGRAREWVAFAPNCVILIRRLRRDHRLPVRGRIALGLALAYLVSPVQLLPNVIPVVGQTDDVLVLMAALRYTCRHLPRGAVEEAWPGDPRYLDRLLGAPIAASDDDRAVDVGPSDPPPVACAAPIASGGGDARRNGVHATGPRCNRSG
jgi:uncharacterized membrane protein YkvA (DUF1232 family)